MKVQRANSEDVIILADVENEVMEKFIDELEEIVLDEFLTIAEFKKRINIFLNGRKKISYVDDAVLTSMGDRLIRDGKYDRGIFLMQNALKRANRGEYSDGITLFLRLAEYEFINGNEDKGTECLIHVCENEVSNYEESIEFRNLTEVWLKYKHYVEGKVRKSEFYNLSTTKKPSECNKSIDEILKIEDEDELLTAFSEHLNELSADGEELNCLNKRERTFFYIDQLLMEVNSGGFESYLYYYGMNFDKAYKASDIMNMEGLKTLLTKVKDQFPKSKIPKKIDKIQDIMDENDLDFEDIDEIFYNETVKEIMACLMEYIRKMYQVEEKL